LLMSLQMKRSEAMRALLPMTMQVLQNYERLGVKAAWTGPLARGDYEVVAKHTTALHQHSQEYGEAYEALNRLAEKLLQRDGDESGQRGRASSIVAYGAQGGSRSASSAAASTASSSRASHSKKMKVLSTGGKG
jgi:hypothetical protein